MGALLIGLRGMGFMADLPLDRCPPKNGPLSKDREGQHKLIGFLDRKEESVHVNLSFKRSDNGKGPHQLKFRSCHGLSEIFCRSNSVRQRLPFNCQPPTATFGSKRLNDPSRLEHPFGEKQIGRDGCRIQ